MDQQGFHYPRFYKKMLRYQNTIKTCTSANSTYPKGGVLCSKDTFVVTGTFVLLINICGESPALRVAAKR